MNVASMEAEREIETNMLYHRWASLEGGQIARCGRRRGACAVRRGFRGAVSLQGDEAFHRLASVFAGVS